MTTDAKRKALCDAAEISNALFVEVHDMQIATVDADSRALKKRRIRRHRWDCEAAIDSLKPQDPISATSASFNGDVVSSSNPAADSVEQSCFISNMPAICAQHGAIDLEYDVLPVENDEMERERVVVAHRAMNKLLGELHDLKQMRRAPQP